MSVDTTLKSLINALPEITGGCHNGVDNSSTITVPYVVFHEISGVPETGISVPYLGLTRFRYQVDVFAKSPEAAKGIALEVVRPAIVNSELEGLMVFQTKGQYSELDKTHQYITEYEIWAA